ncbi:uncharacterized protein I206_107219 [Kwoniella pini CBS 10737]|uniref:Uncharacterized protein n=1 Tax=Kwoniella pini CBS 10737 TaxID=1296096 RepID=A0A1B9HYZ7_9TREE|nr:uncharacterized protein I206_05237 [Kwoniella pini CBS 10737]OCF48458.1 hypothetical protein I206_05237 [Kwoniella pini CBS 10737]
MSESPLNNTNNNQEINKPDAVILNNGTILVAAKDEEGAEVEKDEIPIEDQPKGDLTKIISAKKDDQIAPAEAPGSEDEVDGAIGGDTPARGSSPTPAEDDQPIEPESVNADIATVTDFPPTPTIAEPTLFDPQPSQADPLVRAATPSSRTSTPPLGSSALTKKKFSSVNVNQKFLSKAGSPAPTAGPTKISSVNGRQTASPVPIASSSSRLLSTKLTTVPSAKSSVSSNPPTSASSSPWAKPVVPLPADSSSPRAPIPSAASTPTIHQPAPTRARVLGTTTAPAMGAGLVSAMVPPKPAWKAVSGESRKPGLGISRDFPTAKEVAEGKKAAQTAAQAQAAHNQAILQELNTFTTLDPGAHRWDEEDEDDDVIDFGDGIGENPHYMNTSIHDAPESHPVSKSDRFAEDFDRSWPRRPLPPVESNHLANLPQRPRPDGDTNRVLFNANSNRLEAPRPPPAASIQPTRLMSRPTDSNGRQQPPHLANGRPLPPHLAGGQTGDRSLPPHMSQPPAEPRSQPGASAAAPPTRSAWNVPRENDRHLPPHPADRQELSTQSSAFAQSRSPEKPTSHLPRRSFSQAAGPPHVASDSSSGQPITSPTVGIDAQTAEMHTAAEKAKARRLAEEAEREAAAERARRKAKELEERLRGLASNVESKTSQPQSSMAVKETPQITLAQRPKPATLEQNTQSQLTLPPRPDIGDKQIAPSGRSTEPSWRNKAQAPPNNEEQTANIPSSILSPLDVQSRTNRPTAESFFEAELTQPPKMFISSSADPVAPKKEAVFDDMLARIQAAMVEARNTPMPAQPIIDKSPRQSSRSPEVTPAQSRASQPAQQKPTSIFVQEYFDVTYPEPPKSPPPAWRTYTIRLPKSHPPRPSVARGRLLAAESTRPPISHAWLMSFNPPLDGVNSTSLSRSELLLPQPILRRFQRSEPVVSISPRQLEPFEKKIKKKPSNIDSNRVAAEIPNVSAESLLPAPTTLKSQSLRNQRNRADDWRQTESSSTAEKPLSMPTDDHARMEIPPRKTRSPIKSSAAAKAEREGRFAFDGVTIGVPLPVKETAVTVTDKPGVRFMVSSELEGDSLLDEVNKMSLETLDEDDKTQQGDIGESAKTSGSETPKTPPLPRPASPNTATWPSTSLSYPASHSPARSSSQHDHSALKSVWQSQQPSAKPSSDLNAAAPIYPSLNAPSSTDPTSAQPLPGVGGMKMTFSTSQGFSSPGAAGPSVSTSNPFSSLRPSPATHSPYGQFTSPSPDNLNQHIGMNYTSMSNPQRAGTNGFQQGVWSPTAFGTSMASPGYGYTAVPTKSAMSIDQKPPVTMGYGAKSTENMMYAGYPSTTAAYSQQQQYSSAQGYGTGRGVNQSMYYGYGAPGQQVGARPVNAAQQSRFVNSQANGTEYSSPQQQHQQYNLDQGGYYGGLPNQQQQQVMYGTNSYGHQSHGSVGQNQISRGVGATRKMW